MEILITETVCDKRMGKVSENMSFKNTDQVNFGGTNYDE
ncbi:hypothetical protein MNBD_GAMMA11-771 [hydrothermal vent metagenome]|uniref:Uncharacterized protein n=1 Tax=hydrothermal vent metagenome TaxID=652676 RepID=A0A3B0X5J4_9ZZZZ